MIMATMRFHHTGLLPHSRAMATRKMTGKELAPLDTCGCSRRTPSVRSETRRSSDPVSTHMSPRTKLMARIAAPTLVRPLFSSATAAKNCSTMSLSAMIPGLMSGIPLDSATQSKKSLSFSAYEAILERELADIPAVMYLNTAP